MKIQFCITGFLLVHAVSVFGQDSLATVSENRYSHIDVGIGYLRTDLGSVNGSLRTHGYKPLDENFLTLSVSAAYVINRVMLRTEASFMMTNSVRQSDDLVTRFGGYSLGFGVGYAVIQRPRFRLYPFIGVNAFVNKLIFEDQAPVRDIDDVYNSPHRSFTLLFSNASLDVGLQLDRVIELKNKKWDCPQNGKFMTLGLRLGYHYGPGDIRGGYNGGNQSLKDTPFYSLKGPYVKLVVGLGSKARNLRWKR